VLCCGVELAAPVNSFDNPARIQDLYNEISSDKPLDQIQEAMVKASITAAKTRIVAPDPPICCLFSLSLSLSRCCDSPLALPHTRARSRRAGDEGPKQGQGKESPRWSRY
jgi:hypothetical protein